MARQPTVDLTSADDAHVGWLRLDGQFVQTPSMARFGLPLAYHFGYFASTERVWLDGTILKSLVSGTSADWSNVAGRPNDH
jgi:hypothetical protein